MSVSLIRQSLFMVLFTLFVMKLNAQSTEPATAFANGLLPQLIEASPEASSLGKYGAWPVSQYSGIPNITIPIFAIGIKDFSLPINLSYHGGGVKVDEVSSCVGVNWSLNAGGVISRTVMGLADEAGDGIAYQMKYGAPVKASYNLDAPSDYWQLQNIADNVTDAQCDDYYYNFLGESGRFFLDSLLNMRTVPASNLQFLKTPFSYLQNAGSNPEFSNCRWAIADEKGNIYEFGLSDGNGVETTKTGVTAIESPGAQTAFYLSKIILSNRIDTISFEYDMKSEIYNLPPVQSFRSLLNKSALPAIVTSSYESVVSAGSVLYNGTVLSSAKFRKHYTNGNSSLRKITWRGGSIQFYANTIREDMEPGTGKMLDSIVIFDYNGNKVNSFNLSYNYQGHRYFLNSIVENGKMDIDSQVTSFEYNDISKLPSKNYDSTMTYYCPQDHWGYYNGVVAANSNLLPPNANMPAIVSSFLLGKREPDSIAVQYGALSKIIYPTRGYTKFTYEPNRYDPGTPVGGGSPTAPIVNLSLSVQADTLLPHARVVTFTVPFAQNNAGLTLHIINYPHPPNKNDAPLPYVKLMEGSTLVFYKDAYDAFPSVSPAPNPNGLYSYDFNTPPLHLLPGTTYTLVASDTCLRFTSCVDYNYAMPYVYAVLSYSGYGPIPPPQANPVSLIGPGLRIKEIDNYGFDGKCLDKKIYNYNLGNLIMYPSVYSHKYDINVSEAAMALSGCGAGANCPNYCDIFAEIIEETSSPQTVLGFSQGTPVGYTHVVEKDVDGLSLQDIGYTSYNFSYTPDSLNSLTINGTFWPETTIESTLMPSNSYDFKRGLLLSRARYLIKDHGYIKIDSVENQYDFSNIFSYRQDNLRVNRLLFGPAACPITLSGYLVPGSHMSACFAYAHYYNTTCWVQKTSTCHIQYDEDGLNPIVILDKFQYDNKNMLIQKKINTDSKGKVSIMNFTYPADYNLTGTTSNDISKGVLNLQKNFDIGSIVEQYLQQSNPDGSDLKTTASVFTRYNATIPYPSMMERLNISQQIVDFVPTVIDASSSLLDARYKNQFSFNFYDSYGNILEQQKTDDIKRSYLWDYNSAYPIADVMNAAQADIAATSFEAGGKGNWTFSGIPDNSGGAITGNRSFLLSSGSISKTGLTPTTRYIVSYWSKGNVAVSGGTQNNTFTGKTVNGWTFHEVTITGTTSVTLSGSTYIDELRLYPSGAQMTTYTYQPLIGITSQCGVDDKVQYYEYGGFGRLRAIKDQNGNIIKRFDYHYRQQSNSN